MTYSERILADAEINTRLEHFRPQRLPRLKQAKKARDLVRNEQTWLSEIQPGTVRRFRNLYNSFKNIGRLASADPNFKAHLVRNNDFSSQPVGMATTIHNQRIVHPDKGLVAGVDVDYWLQEDLYFIEIHTAAAKLLKLTALTSPQVFAAVPVDHPNPPLGFQKILEPLGEPAELIIPEGFTDTYDVAKRGNVVQLYVSNTSLDSL